MPAGVDWLGNVANGRNHFIYGWKGFWALEDAGAMAHRPSKEISERECEPMRPRGLRGPSAGLGRDVGYQQDGATALAFQPCQFRTPHSRIRVVVQACRAKEEAA